MQINRIILWTAGPTPIIQKLRFKQNSNGSQGSKGKRQKFIYITNDDTQNYPFCRLELQLDYNKNQ